MTNTTVDEMTTESREHLSCLMDGEISRETGRFLVRRLGADEDLCATWARYHLVRDCLRHGGDRFAGEGLVDVCDVGRMMFAVVNLHRSRIDVRLERFLGIGQRR